MGKEPKIPTFVAVGFWVASALAVGTFTWIAVKETASGLAKGALEVEGAINPEVAAANLIAAEVEPVKGSRVQTFGITPAQLGFGKNKPTRGKFKH
jgi:hypothetical protein